MGKQDRHSIQNLTACREPETGAALLIFLGAPFVRGWVRICLAEFVGMQSPFWSLLKISEYFANGNTLAFPTPINTEGFH